LHSDVKPNNVVLDLYTNVEELVSLEKYGTTNLNLEELRLYLVDFGLSETYINADGTHALPGKIDRQLGNKFFMSLS
jgi:serine/threonine protein kinase